jgi:hypothetical protein
MRPVRAAENRPASWPTTSFRTSPATCAQEGSHSGSECPYYSVTVPYKEVRDLLNPKIVAELPE